MKRSEPQKVAGVMPAYFEALGIADKINEARLMLKWEEQMGEVIRRKTNHLEIKNKVLYVSISSAPLRGNLLMKREHLVQLLNDAVGTTVINDIVFR